jgi:hypothetical protein
MGRLMFEDHSLLESFHSGVNERANATWYQVHEDIFNGWVDDYVQRTLRDGEGSSIVYGNIMACLEQEKIAKNPSKQPIVAI